MFARVVGVRLLDPAGSFALIIRIRDFLTGDWVVDRDRDSSILLLLRPVLPLSRTAGKLGKSCDRCLGMRARDTAGMLNRGAECSQFALDGLESNILESLALRTVVALAHLHTRGTPQS